MLLSLGCQQRPASSAAMAMHTSTCLIRYRIVYNSPFPYVYPFPSIFSSNSHEPCQRQLAVQQCTVSEEKIAAGLRI